MTWSAPFCLPSIVGGMATAQLMSVGNCVLYTLGSTEWLKYMPIFPCANWARSGSMSSDSEPGSMLPSARI
ncbi:hypothetical protein D1872_330450 [compost metagenome]